MRLGEAVVGKNRDELLGHNFWEVSPETIGTVLEQEYRRAVAENLPVAFESYYAPLDRWFSVSTYPSGFGGLAINVRDVTERKLAEIEVARKNQESQQLLERIREMAEAEKLALENKLASELAAVTRLHEFSTRLLASAELQPLLEELLNAIISLQGADFGNIQLYNPESQALEIVVQRGFQQDFLDHFRSVHDDGAACGRAMQRRERIIIEDVQTDPDFEPHRRIAASAGFRAVQSTPLLTRTGELLGMISTHFRQPHRPSEHELRLTDLYAMHAAGLIIRKQSEAAVLRYQQELHALTAKLIEAQEHESKHLARELHDVFSQKLAVLGMEIAALGRKPPETSQALNSGLQQLTAADWHFVERYPSNLPAAPSRYPGRSRNRSRAQERVSGLLPTAWHTRGIRLSRRPPASIRRPLAVPVPYCPGKPAEHRQTRTSGRGARRFVSSRSRDCPGN